MRAFPCAWVRCNPIVGYKHIYLSPPIFPLAVCGSCDLAISLRPQRTYFPVVETFFHGELMESLALKRRSISVFKTSGIPWVANIRSSDGKVFPAAVLEIISTSGYFE